MPTPIKMPQMGESVVEGTVARWLKALGESVEKLEPLLEVSTDKIDTEIPAPISGTLIGIMVAEGETVEAGTIIGYIGDADEDVTGVAMQDVVTQHQVAQSDPPEVSASDGAPHPPTDDAVQTPHTPPGLATRPSGRNFISPVVARIAAENNVDVSQIAGTGMGGRVTKKDLLAFLDSRGSLSRAEQRAELPSAESVLAESRPPSPGPQSRAAIQPATVPVGEDETLHPLTTMRRAIAHHMVQSKAASPHVTTIFEVDMTRVVQHREREKAGFSQRGVALNYTAYFVAATAAALRHEPMANSRFTDEGIVENRRVHIGVAVAIDEGLVVPVLRDADEKNLQGVARAVQDLSGRARAGQLGADELRGGTFTITNHGVGGSLIGTPILNQPQAGILGVGAIVKRPVVRNASHSLLPSADDAIVIRPMCYLNFTFDHRILDGAVADRFVMRIKEALENWAAS